MTGTIGVEAITAGLRRHLTPRDSSTHAVVARWPGQRPVILAAARSASRLEQAAAELARAYGVALAPYDQTALTPVILAGDCYECGEWAQVAVVVVGGREVPYLRHTIPAEHSDPLAHAAVVMGVAA